MLTFVESSDIFLDAILMAFKLCSIFYCELRWDIGVSVLSLSCINKDITKIPIFHAVPVHSKN